MRTIGWLLVAALATGCGYKKEIEGLEVQLSEARQDITERDARISELEGNIRSLEARLSQMEERKNELERQLGELTGNLDEERAKSARILADRGALRSEIDAMKQAMQELEERKRQAEARVKQFKDLVARFQSLIDAGTLDVKIIDGRMVVVLATDILFASGSADLSVAGKDALTQVAAILATMPDKDFQVEGHTDNVPMNSQRFPNNWYLAAGRAIGVVEHMISAGMKAEQVSAASYGETHPVAANDTKESRALNRRIEIVIMPDLSGMPGYDELQKVGQ